MIRTMIDTERGHTYIVVRSAPDHLRWDTPRRYQGQIVLMSFASSVPGRGEASDGCEWMRVEDQSDGSVVFYRLASKA